MALPVAVGGKVTAADINTIANLPVANFAALPSSGNWLGRQVATTDTGVTYRYLGSAWKAWSSDWITYTPTLANITLGTSPTTAYSYRYDGGVIEVQFRIVLGTGGSVGTFPTMTLPVNSQALLSRFELRSGGITLFDTSAAAPFPGVALANDTDVDKVRLYHTNTGAFTNLSATVPFTWAVGDSLVGRFTYVPA